MTNLEDDGWLVPCLDCGAARLMPCKPECNADGRIMCSDCQGKGLIDTLDGDLWVCPTCKGARRLWLVDDA